MRLFIIFFFNRCRCDHPVDCRGGETLVQLPVHSFSTSSTFRSIYPLRLITRPHSIQTADRSTNQLRPEGRVVLYGIFKRESRTALSPLKQNGRDQKEEVAGYQMNVIGYNFCLTVISTVSMLFLGAAYLKLYQFGAILNQRMIPKTISHVTQQHNLVFFEAAIVGSQKDTAIYIN